MNKTVLFIVTNIDSANGICVQNVAKKLIEQRCEVIVLTQSGSDTIANGEVQDIKWETVKRHWSNKPKSQCKKIEWFIRQKENVPPESEKCQRVVKEYWGLIMEFTNGDMSMLPKLMEVGNIDTATNAWEERQKIVNAYLEPALQVYFSRLGTNPFEEVKP